MGDGTSTYPTFRVEDIVRPSDKMVMMERYFNPANISAVTGRLAQDHPGFMGNAHTTWQLTWMPK